ncbi:MAG: hypothetical protein N3A38_06750, partial [Planctomycetota bacterium]|nr:hypothetical protein [Planctomycetota bacterium]
AASEIYLMERRSHASAAHSAEAPLRCSIIPAQTAGASDPSAGKAAADLNAGVATADKLYLAFNARSR